MIFSGEGQGGESLDLSTTSFPVDSRDMYIERGRPCKHRLRGMSYQGEKLSCLVFHTPVV